MKVRDIYSRRPIHIPQSCNLREAATQMKQQHVGALLVTDTIGQRVVGVITDRDIVLHAIARGLDPNTTPIEAVMSNRVVSIEASASISDAMQLMLLQGVRRLAVTEEEALVGLVALDDVIGALGTDWAMLAGVLRAEFERERSGFTQSSPLSPLSPLPR